MKARNAAEATSLRVLNRLPIINSEKNNKALSLLLPEFKDIALLVHGQETDTIVNQKFLKTDFNFQIDSYKSPHTNQFFPNQTQTYYNTARVTKFEKALQESVHEFAKFTYINPVTSCFVWDNQEKELGAAIFIQKKFSDQRFQSAQYDQRLQISIAGQVFKDIYHLNYTVTGTIQFQFIIKENDQLLNQSGVIPYEKKKMVPYKQGTINSMNWESLLPVIGKFVEDMDSHIRQSIKNHIFATNVKVIQDLKVNTEEESKEIKQKKEEFGGFLDDFQKQFAALNMTRAKKNMKDFEINKQMLF